MTVQLHFDVACKNPCDRLVRYCIYLPEFECDCNNAYLILHKNKWRRFSIENSKSSRRNEDSV